MDHYHQALHCNDCGEQLGTIEAALDGVHGDFEPGHIHLSSYVVGGKIVTRCPDCSPDGAIE